MICQVCGKEIPQGSCRKKYCGAECAKIAQRRMSREHIGRKTVRCVNCGKAFERNGTKSVFCSTECRRKYNSGESRIAEKHCKVCGKKFVPGRELKNYCSTRCRDAAKDKTLAEARRIIKGEDHSLSDLVAEARAHGMSYGKYVLAKEIGRI